MKDGLKSHLFEIAQKYGPKLEEVLELISFLVNGKVLVGYNLPMKLTNLGLIGLKIPESTVDLNKIISEKFALNS